MIDNADESPQHLFNIRKIAVEAKTDNPEHPVLQFEGDPSDVSLRIIKALARMRYSQLKIEPQSPSRILPLSQQDLSYLGSNARLAFLANYMGLTTYKAIEKAIGRPLEFNQQKL